MQRNVSVTTRNQRLAAMKAFAHYVQYRNPEYLENCTDIIAMRPKKHEKPVIPFLTEEELKALVFSYHTGEEALAAAKKSVRAGRNLTFARTPLPDGTDCFSVMDNEGSVIEKHTVLKLLK